MKKNVKRTHKTSLFNYPKKVESGKQMYGIQRKSNKNKILVKNK